jgi:hypothetical protein
MLSQHITNVLALNTENAHKIRTLKTQVTPSQTTFQYVTLNKHSL